MTQKQIRKHGVKKIVWVDDDPFSGYTHRQLVFDGYELVGFYSASSCLHEYFVNDAKKSVDMFILDVMMPTDEEFKLLTNFDAADGLLTGLYLAITLRKIYKKVPIVLYSGSTVSLVKIHAKQLEKKLSNCAFITKSDYPPNKLVKFVNNYFVKGKFTVGLLQKVIDSIVLQPNISGVGIDVKQLIE